MPRKPLTLTKATRLHTCKTFHLLPHQLLAAEQVSLRNRLDDALDERTALLLQLEKTEERQEFNHILKKELPKLDKLIQRLTDELQRISSDYSKELKTHLDSHNRKWNPGSTTD